MRLFGKKANQQYEMTDVPPELRPYYREQSIAAHAHGTALRLVLVFVVLILLIGGAVDLLIHYKHKVSPPSPHVTTSQVSSQSSQTQGQPSSSSTAQSQQANNTTPNTSSSAPSGGSTPTSSQNPSTTPQQPSTTQNPSGQTATSSSIPNTGPGQDVFIAVLLSSVSATIIYHVYQRRAKQIHRR